MKAAGEKLRDVIDRIRPSINNQRKAISLDLWSPPRTQSRARKMLKNKKHRLELAGVEVVGSRYLVFNPVQLKIALGLYATKRFHFTGPLDFLLKAEPGGAYQISTLRECIQMTALFKETNLTSYVYRQKEIPAGVRLIGDSYYLVTGRGERFGKHGLRTLICGEGWHFAYIEEILKSEPLTLAMQARPFWPLFEEAGRQLFLIE